MLRLFNRSQFVLIHGYHSLLLCSCRYSHEYRFPKRYSFSSLRALSPGLEPGRCCLASGRPCVPPTFALKEGQTDFHADPPLVKPGRHGSDSDHFAHRKRPRQPTLRSSPALRLGPECPCSLPRPSDRWSHAAAPRVARWPGCRRPPTWLSRRLSRPSALTPAASDIFRSFCHWP